MVWLSLNQPPNIAEFLGWHIGDGCISINKRYSEFTLTGDLTEELPFYKEVIIPTFNRLFSKSLKKPVNLKKYKSNGVCGIYLFDRSFVDHLQNKFHLPSGKKINIQVPQALTTDNQKRCFLRGLFDTDGSIYFCKSNFKTKNESFFTIVHYKPKIKLATISKSLIRQVHEMLQSLGFSPRLLKPAKQKERENTVYGVVLDTNKDTKMWIDTVGFRNPKHLTKVHLWEKVGFCPPYTTLKDRRRMLREDISPLGFYPEHPYLSLNSVKKRLLKHRDYEEKRRVAAAIKGNHT